MLIGKKKYWIKLYSLHKGTDLTYEELFFPLLWLCWKKMFDVLGYLCTVHMMTDMTVIAKQHIRKHLLDVLQLYCKNYTRETG